MFLTKWNWLRLSITTINIPLYVHINISNNNNKWQHILRLGSIAVQMCQLEEILLYRGRFISAAISG